MERAKFPTVPETAIDPLQWNVAERGKKIRDTEQNRGKKRGLRFPR
jgi:hypothetical protein